MEKPKQQEVDKSLREKFGAVIKMIRPRYEKTDPTPIAPPIGFKRQPSLSEQIRDMVRSERLAADLAAGGVETFEEADDFSVEDDLPDPSTPYEAHFDVPVEELRRRQQADLELLQAGGNPDPDLDGEGPGTHADRPPKRPSPKKDSETREDAAAAPPEQQSVLQRNKLPD